MKKKELRVVNVTAVVFIVTAMITKCVLGAMEKDTLYSNIKI